MSTGHRRALARLSAIVGSSNVLTKPLDMEPFLSEPRRYVEAKALAAIMPGDVFEVARVLDACRELGIPVVPQSGNTGLVVGQVSEDPDSLILSLRRLNRIRRLDPANNTVLAEAGLILADLQEAVQNVNREFFLNLTAQGSSMIGGLIATNAGGVHAASFGSMRDHVLGVEFVLPSGEICSELHGLRKHNAGPRLSDLMIGSEGMFGVITAASLKLGHQLCERKGAWLRCPRIEDAVRIALAVRNLAGRNLVAAEMMNAFTVSVAASQVQDPSPAFANGDTAFHLLLECGSTRNVQVEFEELLMDALDGDDAVHVVVAQNQRELDRFWHIRHMIPEQQRTLGPTLKHDISLPLGFLAEFYQRVGQQLELVCPGVRVYAFGHVGDGNLHFNLSPPVDANACFIKAKESLREVVHEAVLSRDGSIFAEHGVGRWRVSELSRMREPVSIDRLRDLKNVLDPSGIMNPGVILSAATPGQIK